MDIIGGSCPARTILMLRVKIVGFKLVLVMEVDENFKDYGNYRNQSNRTIDGRIRAVISLFQKTVRMHVCNIHNFFSRSETYNKHGQSRAKYEGCHPVYVH